MNARFTFHVHCVDNLELLYNAWVWNANFVSTINGRYRVEFVPWCDLLLLYIPLLQTSDSTTLLRLPFSYPFFFYIYQLYTYKVTMQTWAFYCVRVHLVLKCICPWTKCDCNQEKQQAYQFCGSVLISFANNSYLFFKAKVSIA